MPTDLDRLRAAHPIDAVAQAAGVELRPSGRRLVGRCPFHDDRHPSFTIYPDTASYFCFGCGAGGDVFDLLGRLLGLDFRGVLIHLGAAPARAHREGDGHRPRRPDRFRAGTITSAGQPCGTGSVSVPTGHDGACPRVDSATLAVVDAAACFYHAQLWVSPAARAYLSGRGITAAMAHRERLGYAPGSGLARHLRAAGLDLARAEAVGLLAGEREPMVGRVIIPDLRDGRTTWLTGRAVDGHGPEHPRYRSLRLPLPLFREAAVAGDEVTVVEGAFDWLVLHAWALPVVALLGSHASRATLWTLGRFTRVYLALDADAAGRRATEVLRAALGARAVGIALSSGVKDPADLILRPDGYAALIGALRAAGYRDAHAGPSLATSSVGPRAA